MFRTTPPWLLMVLLAPLACGASNSKPAESGSKRDAEDRAPEQAAGATANPAGVADDEPTPAEIDVDRLADLDALCAAIDHDYKDGTLGDYYADVEPKTKWGTALMEAGNKADQPARHLEGEVDKIDGGADHPALPSCKTLMEYIDDVE